jgi:hypothetical protein
MTEGWLPATSMPRDGSWFWAKNETQTRYVRYDDKYDRLPIGDDGKIWSTLPTHWRRDRKEREDG